MNNKRVRKFLFGTIILFSSCNFEDTYVAPCEGKYGKQKIIDSIKSTLNLENISITKVYKNSDTIPTNCDTINMQIYGDSISDIVNANTFVQTISKIFFSDTANTNIKYLKLYVTNYSPVIGKMKATYVLDRNSSINNNALNMPIDTNYYGYKIIEASPHTILMANEKLEGMQIDINLVKEPKDIIGLAGEIKQKYNKEIHGKSLDEFSIYFNIETPNNKYCISKVYSVFYSKRNKDL